VSKGASSILVLQGGGPTPVLNVSLCAVIDEAMQSGKFDRVLGARRGIEGLARGEIVHLTQLSPRELARIRKTPGASLGTTRFKPAATDLDSILATLARFDVRHLVLIGGNGSLRGAHAISEAARAAGYELCVVGVPKTVDNDIPGTDRCPGYASAARYIAQSVRDLGCDVAALPQPVSIIETMGRSVGWLAAATALARRDEREAPHLVYLPEHAFAVDRFIGDVDRVVRKVGHAVVVVNEGIRGADGKLVYEIASSTQRDACDRALPGGVANFLADAVTKNLKIRCRTEKPGLCGRASMLHLSAQDVHDADLVGRSAVRAAVENRSDVMVSLLPLGAGGCQLVALESAAGKDRPIPAQWLDSSDLGVNANFLDYVRPLVGELLDYAPPLSSTAPAASPQIQPESLLRV
jgi:ATP-dependent phosphofructokinase / diphosphate-dependent phosphofructokinase